MVLTSLFHCSGLPPKAEKKALAKARNGHEHHGKSRENHEKVGKIMGKDGENVRKSQEKHGENHGTTGIYGDFHGRWMKVSSKMVGLKNGAFNGKLENHRIEWI